VDLSTRDRDGNVIVALRGELDLADAATVAAAPTKVAARTPQIIVDLAAQALPGRPSIRKPGRPLAAECPMCAKKGYHGKCSSGPRQLHPRYLRRQR
jgi:hypothetical protein